MKWSKLHSLSLVGLMLQYLVTWNWNSKFGSSSFFLVVELSRSGRWEVIFLVVFPYIFFWCCCSSSFLVSSFPGVWVSIFNTSPSHAYFFEPRLDRTKTFLIGTRQRKVATPQNLDSLSNWTCRHWIILFCPYIGLNLYKTRWWFQICLYVHPDPSGSWSNSLTHVFQIGWFNHHLENDGGPKELSPDSTVRQPGIPLKMNKCT